MPEAVVAIVSAIGAEVGGSAGAFLIMNAEIVASAALIAGSAGLSYAQQRAAKRKARDAYNASLQDRLANVVTTTGPRELVLGRVRKGGNIAVRQSTGATKEKFYMCLTLAGHEIDAVEAVYLNDVEVTLDGSGYVTDEPYSISNKQSYTETFSGASITLAHTPIVGSVVVTETTGTGLDTLTYEVAFTLLGSTVTVGGSGARTVQYQASSGPSKAKIWWHLGTTSQTADADLIAAFPGDWTSAHRARGVAYLVCEFTYDENAFPSGLPAVTARIRGAKVYDPRTATTAWSENPALLARHVLLHPYFGKRTSLSAAEEDRIEAAANACDTSHDYIVEYTTTTQALYKGSYVAIYGAEPKGALDDLVQAMAGQWVYAAGEFFIRAGVYTAPVADFDESDLAVIQTSTGGSEEQIPIKISAHQARASKANTITARIWDKDQGYKEVPLSPVTSAALIARDGATLTREISLPAISFAPQAQHVCGVIMRDERDPLRVTASFRLTAYAVEILDVISLTLDRYEWVAKPFLVVGRTWTHDGKIALSLKETAAAIYQPDADFLPQGYAENTNLPRPWDIDPPTLDTIDSGTSQLIRQADGTIVPRVLVSWDAITDASLLQGGFVEVAMSVNADEFQVFQTTADKTSLYLTGVKEDDVIVVKMRTRNSVAVSDWSLQDSHLVVGKSAAPSAVTSLSANAIAGGIRIICTLPTDADLACLELYRGTSSTLAAATLLGARNYPPSKDRTLQASYDDNGLSAADGPRYYWVYAVDTSGNRSAVAGPVNATANNLNALTITSNAGNVINVSYGGTLSPATITLTATKSSGLTGTILWTVASGTATLGSSSGATTAITTSTVASQSLTVRATIQGITLYRWDSTVGTWTITNSGRTASKTIAGGGLTAASAYTGLTSPTSTDTTIAGKKTYVEIPITTRGGHGRICVGIIGTASGGLMDVPGAATAWGVFAAVAGSATVSGVPQTGRVEGGVYTSDATYQFGPGDIMMLAPDLVSATKKLYIGKNGTWLNGDPVAGTGGMTVTGTINRFSVALLNPSGETNSYSVDIMPTAGTQTYAAPTGFSPYGALESDITADYTINKQVASISGSDLTTAATVIPSALGTGTATVNSVEFQFGSGITIGSQSAGGGFKANGTTRFGFIVGNIGAGDAIGCGTTATGSTYAAGHFVGGANSGFTTYKTWARLALGDTAAGDFGHAGASTLPGTFSYRCQLATNGYAAYAASGWGKQYFVDGAGPFTAFHQGVAPRGEYVDGDILVRTGVCERQNVSNVRFWVKLSDAPYQRGALGVVSGVREIGFELGYEKWWELHETHCLVDANAVGEGQINVCGVGGDIAVDDFIVTSPIPGKGMRQADDVAHGYTVAKASEACTFASPDEVKQIACIYLAG